MNTRTPSVACAIVAFLWTVGSAKSSSAADTIQVGAKGGANVATFAGDITASGGAVTKSARPGLTAGIQSAFNFGMFGVQPELLYSQRGVTLTYDDQQNSSREATRMNYAAMPILGRFNLSVPGVPLTVKVLAGPVVSYYFSGATKTTSDLEGARDTSSVEIDREDTTVPTFGLSGGAGVELGLGPGAVTLDLRYTRELSPVFDAETYFDDTYHSFFSGHLGYVVGF